MMKMLRLMMTTGHLWECGCDRSASATEHPSAVDAPARTFCCQYQEMQKKTQKIFNWLIDEEISPFWVPLVRNILSSASLSESCEKLATLSAIEMIYDMIDNIDRIEMPWLTLLMIMLTSIKPVSFAGPQANSDHSLCRFFAWKSYEIKRKTKRG